jgi:hypothetical protein
MRQPRLRYKDMTPEQQAFQRARTAEYRRRNLGKCRSYSRSYYLANREELKKNSIRQKCRRYGLSVAEFGVMLGKQEGLCAICGTNDPGSNNHGKQSFCIDHDHATGKLRSLLCDTCNKGLGTFKDSAAVLMAAASYLDRHRVLPSRQFVFRRGA